MIVWMKKNIFVKGARTHNLKNINIEIPRNQMVTITGLSGSGKSSLAFDTIFAEGQRRYVETFSAYTRQFLNRMDRPDVDAVEGVEAEAVVAHEVVWAGRPEHLRATGREPDLEGA